MTLSFRKIDCVGLGILSLLFLLLLFLNETSIVSCRFNSSRHSLQNMQGNNILSQHFLTLLSFFFCPMLSGRYCQTVLVNTVYSNALPLNVPPVIKWDRSSFLNERYKAVFRNVQIIRSWWYTLETNFILLKGKMGLYRKLQSFLEEHYICFDF